MWFRFYNLSRPLLKRLKEDVTLKKLYYNNWQIISVTTFIYLNYFIPA